MENKKSLPNHTALYIASNLADALHYLHYLRYLHLGNPLDEESLGDLNKAIEIMNKSHKLILKELDI